jgi:hypothetical protein
LRFGKFRGACSTLRGKVEVKQNPRGVPASRRPQHERQKENEDTKPFPVSSDRSPFPDRPQYFSTLRYTDKYWPGDESYYEAETTWL